VLDWAARKDLEHCERQNTAKIYLKSFIRQKWDNIHVPNVQATGLLGCQTFRDCPIKIGCYIMVKIALSQLI